MDEMESAGNGRKMFYVLLGIFLVVAVLIILTKTSPKNVSTETAGATSCPDDYCLDWVYGSCSGAGERYSERTCFDYPDSAASADACEQGKGIYYDKGSQLDQAC